jgi:hypothetical protein
MAKRRPRRRSVEEGLGDFAEEAGVVRAFSAILAEGGDTECAEIHTWVCGSGSVGAASRMKGGLVLCCVPQSALAALIA